MELNSNPDKNQLTGKNSNALRIITTVVLFLTVAAIFFSVVCTMNNKKYNSSEKATVTAVVSYREYFDRSDENGSDTGYNIYVNYDYNDKSYKQIFYTESVFENEYEIGQQFDVEIYCEEPDTIAFDTSSSTPYAYIGAGVGSVLSVVLLIAGASKRKKENSIEKA